MDVIERERVGERRGRNQGGAWAWEQRATSSETKAMTETALPIQAVMWRDHLGPSYQAACSMQLKCKRSSPCIIYELPDPPHTPSTPPPPTTLHDPRANSSHPRDTHTLRKACPRRASCLPSQQSRYRGVSSGPRTLKVAGDLLGVDRMCIGIVGSGWAETRESEAI